MKGNDIFFGLRRMLVPDDRLKKLFTYTLLAYLRGRRPVDMEHAMYAAVNSPTSVVVVLNVFSSRYEYESLY